MDVRSVLVQIRETMRRFPALFTTAEHEAAEARWQAFIEEEVAKAAAYRAPTVDEWLAARRKNEADYVENRRRDASKEEK